MSDAPILVSVIIGTYNHKHYLRHNLKALQKQQLAHEVILVDDHSTDGTSEYVKRYFPKVKVIRQTKNQGFATAINCGASIAKGKYLFIENADMEVSNNYLTSLVDYLQQHQNIAAVQGAIYDYDHRNQIVTTGLLFHPLGIVVSALRIRRIPPPVDEILAGDALLVRKASFRRIGGYDEACRLYYEDLDFGWRLWLTGYRICSLASAKLYHKGNTLTKASTYSFALRFNLYTSIKNLENTNAISAVVARFLLSVFGVFLFLLKGQFSYVLATGQAWMWLISHLPTILNKRQQIQASRRLTDAKLYQEVGGQIDTAYLRVISSFYLNGIYNGFSKISK